MPRDRVPGAGETITIAAAGSADGPRWDAFVRATPGSQFAHLWGWRRIVEEVHGHDFLPLTASDGDGTLLGILPVVRMKTPLLGHALISVPFLNYGGPLGSAPACDALVGAVVENAHRSGADRIELRSRAAMGGQLTPIARKILVTLDLPASEAVLWDSFPSKLRSQIRRPQKEGMEFKTGSEQIEAFYSVFSRNMRDLGTPVYHRRFFDAIAETFDQVLFGAVYYKGEPIAAGCGFMWRDEFEMTWASALRDFNKLSPNMLLYWGFMQELTKRSARVFNFGRSSPGTGPHRFKLQWGGSEHALSWSGWSARPETGDGTPSKLVRSASAAWQRLPLPIANRLGPVIARRLPWW